LKALKADGDVSAELQAEFIKNPGGVREILDLKDEAKAAGAEVADVFANLDDLKALKADGDVSAELQAEFIKNPGGVREILDLKDEAKAAGAKVADVFANLDDLKALKADGDVSTELQAEFIRNPGGVREILDLKNEAKAAGAEVADVFANFDDLKEMVAKAEADAAARVAAGDATATADLETLFKNADQASDLKAMVDKAEDVAKKAQEAAVSALVGEGASEEDIFLATASAGTADLSKLFENADQAADLKAMVEKSETDAAARVAAGDATATASLSTLFANADQAADLKEMVEKSEADAAARVAAGDATAVASLDTLFENADKASDLKAVVDAAEGAGKGDTLDGLFRNADKADDIKHNLETAEGDAGKLDVLLKNPEMAEQMKNDPGLVDLAKDDPAFFATVKDSDASNENISSSLLNDLKDLGLSGEELTKVLADLNAGPGENQQAADLPAEKPADAVLTGQSGTVSLLASQVIEGNIDPNLVLSSQQAFASEFFETVAAVYGELADPAPVEGQAPPFKVFGGKTITVNAGQYDVGNVYGGPTHDDFLIAAADKLTVVGNIVFNNTDESLASTEDGLKLFSAGNFDLSGAEQISYAGDTLTLGSFDTMEVIDVDLAAEGKVSVRSLDSLVINNVEMATAGNGGADFVHLRAFGEISATNLRFSEQVRQIAMSAMTINLTNVTFPGSSQVNLNSLYGGVNGKYPTFGSANQAFGRVNFINQVRYGTNLLNSPAAFDQHGGAITIGVK
jgi:hypothetical protein